MNGTLDLLDTFFGTITGIWSRILSFFVTCWIGFGLGILAEAVRWTWDGGFVANFAISDWYFVPISWMFMCLSTCLHWYGCVHLLVLIFFAFRIFFSEMNMCQAICSLLLIESWYWWFVGEHIDFTDFSSDAYWELWHPMLWFLVCVSAITAWLWWRSWRNNHPVSP